MEKRDGGHKVDTSCLFMTDGASPSVHRVIELLTRNADDAFLTPIPQCGPYPPVKTVPCHAGEEPLRARICLALWIARNPKCCAD